jgi:4-hydroxy-3-methylbut-2-en-1-yl diphosphate reductase
MSTSTAVSTDQPASDRITRPLTIRLAAPRGFCAGVDRAIQIVERAIEKWGAPVYVRHEIVHNVHVVDRLKRLGAVFVDKLEQCPDDRPVIFSAHGVPKRVPAQAQARRMVYVDATCPLVSKVHVEAQRHHEAGREVVLIGHAGHPEVEGTMGQLPDGAVQLVEDLADVAALVPRDPAALAFVTQTTLSVDDTAEIVAALQARFPAIASPHKEDICYATTNRQDAVKALAREADLVLVIGSRTSSNSLRLVEVAERAGAGAARLVDDAAGIDWDWFEGVSTLGLTAGASAPEDLVEAVVQACRARFAVVVEEVQVTREDVTFRLPRALDQALD